MKDRVIFRKTRDYGVIAFLPDVEVNRGMIMSYAHIGQHGEASRDFYYDTGQATPDEYKELHEELTSIGYDLKVIKRLNVKRITER